MTKTEPQPNKPGAAPEPGDNSQAVKNQGDAKPSDYPDPARLDEEDRG
jgi:hypothetical protein